MESRFTQAFEQGIQQINYSLTRKGGVKKLDKVWERIGRLKQKHSSVNKLYDISIENDGGDKATSITCSRKKESVKYFLRTSLPTAHEQTI